VQSYFRKRVSQNAESRLSLKLCKVSDEDAEPVQKYFHGDDFRVKKLLVG